MCPKLPQQRKYIQHGILLAELTAWLGALLTKGQTEHTGISTYLVQHCVGALGSYNLQGSIQSKLLPTVREIPTYLCARAVCNFIDFPTSHVRAEGQLVRVIQKAPVQNDHVTLTRLQHVIHEHESVRLVYLNTTVLHAGVPSGFSVASCKNLACLTDELFFNAVSNSPRHVMLLG